MTFSKEPTLANPAGVGLLGCSQGVDSPAFFWAKARYRTEIQKTFLIGWQVLAPSGMFSPILTIPSVGEFSAFGNEEPRIRKESITC